LVLPLVNNGEIWLQLLNLGEVQPFLVETKNGAVWMYTKAEIITHRVISVKEEFRYTFSIGTEILNL